MTPKTKTNKKKSFFQLMSEVNRLMSSPHPIDRELAQLVKEAHETLSAEEYNDVLAEANQVATVWSVLKKQGKFDKEAFKAAMILVEEQQRSDVKH